MVKLQLTLKILLKYIGIIENTVKLVILVILVYIIGAFQVVYTQILHSTYLCVFTKNHMILYNKCV